MSIEPPPSPDIWPEDDVTTLDVGNEIASYGMYAGRDADDAMPSWWWFRWFRWWCAGASPPMDWMGVNADVEDGVVDVFIADELIKFAVAATILEESA